MQMWLPQDPFVQRGGSPSAVVPCEGLQRDLVLLDGDCKVVWVKHSKIPEELLHLVYHLPQVHFCQVLQPQVLNSVGEDCAQELPLSCIHS